ncbi:unnamed protein product [Adineta steineri]|uniref:NHL repeat containing protein n=1 Tax=Adineta steineri TaxID=433720 RepID=A0A819HU97_9BILA|nr:unnamed protein product [Adineta steineri]CAF1212409.1 unnamed protein product [Adineta steineri]CAF3859119.1 unnamed protein product [Adineta steineri]CAF3906467.1 unnamed protein product [Adineta steineri]CAF3914629.1 unnamed protein product [Adineta steineri]
MIIAVLLITIPIAIIKTKKINIRETSLLTTKEVTTITDNPTTKEQNKTKCNRWKQQGITVAGGNGQGNEVSQLSAPEGIFINDNNTIFVADYYNNRIIEWKHNSSNGQIVINETDQLWSPTDVIVDQEKNFLIVADSANQGVTRWFCENLTNPQILMSYIYSYGLAMDKYGFIYVSDSGNNEVRRWAEEEPDGTVVAGGNKEGYSLNQLTKPAHIFVDEDYSVYVTDMNNHRVIKWKKDAKYGIVVAGGHGPGISLDHLYWPNGVIVDHLRQIFVADSGNHRIMRWNEGDTEGSIVIGGNGKGTESNQLNTPSDLSFDVEGNLYVADKNNHRIQKYELCFE